MTKDEPDRALVGRLRGSVLLMGPLLARRGRARDRAAGRRLSDAPDDSHASRGARAHGRARLRRAQATRSRRLKDSSRASYYLDEASVTGTETALLAAAAATGPHRDSSRRLRAARRRAVRVPRRHGRGRRGRRQPDDHASKAFRKLRGADANVVGRLHRGRQLGGRRRRSPAATSRSAARAGRTWKSSARCSSKMNVHCEHDGTIVPRGAAHADQRRPHHDRPVARVSERSDQPRHRRSPRRRRARRSCTTGSTSCACIRSSR